VDTAACPVDRRSGALTAVASAVTAHSVEVASNHIGVMTDPDTVSAVAALLG
jgi:hypothetical protein